MKNTIIIGTIIVLGLIVLMFWQKGVSTATLPVNKQIQKGSVLTSNEKDYDFGTISMKDGNVSTTFVVVNGTENDLRIDSVVTSCMCTTAYIVKEEGRKGPFGMPGHNEVVPRANEIIKAGEEWTIEVIFDPAAHGPEGAGLVERNVYIVDEQGGALELNFTANVTL